MVKDRDAAQDLFQETFIKVVREIKLGKYVEQNHFSAWLYRIAYNLTISAIRKSKAMPFDSAKSDFNPFDFILSNDDSNEDKFIKENNANIIKILIQKLPEEQREVVIMRYYSNMSFAEIAEVTNVSLNTSLGRMRYALAKLRKLIQNCQLDLAA
jgi:RNA polymerase sigma-70 factor (ECF subfamily)